MYAIYKQTCTLCVLQYSISTLCIGKYLEERSKISYNSPRGREHFNASSIMVVSEQNPFSGMTDFFILRTKDLAKELKIEFSLYFWLKRAFLSK